MGILQHIYYFFSCYTDPTERRVGKFFNRVNEREAHHKIEKSLLRLLQQDIAVVNLWTEQRYKGYDYLTKRTRKQLYENLAAIKHDFEVFSASQQTDIKQVLDEVKGKGVDVSMLRTRQEQLAHIVAIMQYLAPRNGRYVYRSSSSFGRLLRDPSREVLEGDCNQIVTLYIALFAMKHDVSDLNLTIYPGHVALHFHGVDIETTNGTFANYNKEGQYRAPLHEIVSVNLLDTTDTNFTKSAVNPEVFLQAARMAYVVSSNRSLVKNNLEIAYHNAVRHMMKADRYDQALTYARQSKSYELIEAAAHNGAVHAMRQHNFAAARRFAASTQKKQELLIAIDRNEAAYLYNARNYEAAVRIFSRLGDTPMVKQSYRALYVAAQTQLKGVRTVGGMKAHAGTIRTMERYAKLSGDAGLLKHVQSLTKHL